MGGLLVWWFRIDRGLPLVDLEGAPEVVGRNAVWVVNIRAAGRSGLESVVIRLVSGDRTFDLAERSFEPKGWAGSGVSALRIPVEVDLGELGVPEGPATLEVLAETHGLRVFDRQRPMLGRFPQVVDRTPPVAQVVSNHHNVRLGGSSVGVFRLGADAEEMVVRVADYRFPVVRGLFVDPALGISVFAVPQDLSVDAQPFLQVSDAVGNLVQVPIPTAVRDRLFRDRTLEISDGFLRRKIPQLYSSQGLAVPDDLLDGYLRINREMRKRSEAQLREVTRESRPRPLWTGAFRRLSRSQTMSQFGDRRAYSHEGEVVDRQTHLGVDLASLQRAEVEAAQNGSVVFAGDLGIYGNTVVLDHGLGVATLYGHLSSIEVGLGDEVEAGQVIGRTGQSGLAGGDHLHYSTLVRGVHVDPVEWWDPKWIRDHVAAKLESFPAAVPGREEGDGDGQEPS